MKRACSLVLAFLLIFSSMSVAVIAVEPNAIYFNGKTITENIKNTSMTVYDTSKTTSYVSYIVNDTAKTVEIRLINVALGFNSEGAVSDDANYSSPEYLTPLYINYPGYNVVIKLGGKNSITSCASLEKGSAGIYCNAESLTLQDFGSLTQGSLQIVCSNAVMNTAGIYCTGSCIITDNVNVPGYTAVNVSVYTSVKGSATAVYTKGNLTVNDGAILKTKVAGFGGKFSSAVYSEGDINVTGTSRLWAIGYYRESTTKAYGIYQNASDSCFLNLEGEVIAKGYSKSVYVDAGSGHKKDVYTNVVNNYTSGAAYYCPYREAEYQRSTWDFSDNGNVSKMAKLFENYTLFLFPGKVYMSVGGEYVHDMNKANVFGDGTVSFDSETNTLTLNGAVLTNNMDTDTIWSTYEYDPDKGYVVDTFATGRHIIYFFDRNNATLTINLKGENILYSGDNVYRGIYINSGKLEIGGTGELHISMDNTCAPKIGHSSFSVSVFNTVGIQCDELTVSGADIVLDVDITTTNGAGGIRAGGITVSDSLITVDVNAEKADSNMYVLYGIDMGETSENIGLITNGNARITVNTGNVLGWGSNSSESKGICGANWIRLADNSVVYARAGTATYSCGFELDNDYWEQYGSWNVITSVISGSAGLYAYSNGGGNYSYGFYMCCGSVWTANARACKVKLNMNSKPSDGKYPTLCCGSGPVAEGKITSALMLKCESSISTSMFTDSFNKNTAYVTYSDQSSGIGAVTEKCPTELSNQMNDNNYNKYINTNNKYGAQYSVVNDKLVYTDGARYVQIWVGGETAELRFHLKEGDSSVWKDLYVVNGTILGKNTPKPTRQGYTFKCWASYGYSGLVEYNTSWTVSPTSGYLDLYAMWEKDITIEFVAGKGECSKSEFTKTVDEGSTITASEFSHIKPTIQYGKFLYWEYKDKDGVTQKVTNTTQFNENTTLHAVYERTQYVIQLDANGGELISTLLLVDVGKKYYTALPTPTKMGYSFKGWKDSNGNMVNADVVAENDTTLTAVWEKIHTHSVEKTVFAVFATCKNEGNNKYYQCSCGKYFSDAACTIETTAESQTIAKTTVHAWDSGNVTRKATCKDTGEKTFTCTVCGTTRIETIAKLSVHTFNEGEIITPATATADGVKQYTCTVCGETKTEKIPITAPEYTLGDVDGNGVINVDDARLALRAALNKTDKGYDFSVKTSREFLSADTDSDGTVEVSDARSILRSAINLK